MSRYGRKGFSTKKSIRKLLEPYEHTPTGSAHHALVAILGIPAVTAEALLPLLPLEQLQDRVRDGAPTLEELVRLGVSIDGSVLSGFRVGPDRIDERITLTRLSIPHNQLHFERVSALSEATVPAPVQVGPDGSIYVDWS